MSQLLSGVIFAGDLCVTQFHWWWPWPADWLWVQRSSYQ